MSDLIYFSPLNYFRPLWEAMPRTIQPAVDLYQTEDEVIVTAEIPGIENRDNLEISISPDSLSIRGTVQRTKEVKSEDYFQSERSYGSFFRAIPLPRGLNTEKATANYRNGILEIRIPKSQKEQKRKLDINMQ